MSKNTTITKEYSWLPTISPNYYGWQLSIGNIPDGSYVWLDDNKHAELYRLVSKELDSNENVYNLTFEYLDNSYYYFKCHVNTSLSVKVYAD